MGRYIRSIFLISIINIPCLFVFSQNIENVSVDRIKQIVYTLASDSMQGRAAGSEGEERAKNYLVSYYKKIGLVALNGSYIEKFMFPKDSTHTASAMNVIGMLDNKAPSTIVIGAHYDHIGMGGPKSRSLTSNKIHNGADDNASGVAMMLMLAEYLKTSNKFNYLFIAFSAHEDGLYGSKAFVAENKYDLSKIKLMLNFDMVGRLDTANPILKAVRSEKDIYLDSLLNCVSHNKFQLKINKSNISRTDASVFTNNNIPAITFTTGTHDDYHKVSDDAEKINYNGLYEIFEYFNLLLNEINLNIF